MNFILREWKFFAALLLVLFILGTVYSEYREYKDMQKKAPAPPVTAVNTAGQPAKAGEAQVVYVKGDNTHTKEIVYVPKEIDPKTAELEKTDVQFDRKGNKIYVTVNGKEFEVPSNIKEEAKFENGKLVITEQTEMHVDITAPKPAFYAGLGWSENGAAVQLNGPLYKSVSWWMYGDRKTVAGGLQFPITK